MNVLTLGTFDLFHYGHAIFLKQCLSLVKDGSYLSVGLNTDNFIEKYKGKKPVMCYEEREAAIKLSGFSKDIVPNNQEDGTIKDVIKLTNPGLIVIGSDWHSKDYLNQLGVDWDYLRKIRCGVCYVPYTKSISTTEIKRRILEN